MKSAILSPRHPGLLDGRCRQLARTMRTAMRRIRMATRRAYRTRTAWRMVARGGPTLTSAARPSADWTADWTTSPAPCPPPPTQGPQFAGLSPRSGKQDLNLRPPGPQPGPRQDLRLSPFYQRFPWLSCELGDMCTHRGRLCRLRPPGSSGEALGSQALKPPRRPSRSSPDDHRLRVRQVLAISQIHDVVLHGPHQHRRPHARRPQLASGPRRRNGMRAAARSPHRQRRLGG